MSTIKDVNILVVKALNNMELTNQDLDQLKENKNVKSIKKLVKLNI